jgi:hypothetical protein
VADGATANTGDITSVVAGTGLTGGATSGAATVNVIGGTGITANANDIAITPAQTTITSVYNTSLKLGRDSQNLIDFATTDNKIIFRANGGNMLDLYHIGSGINALCPSTDDNVRLGTSDNQWSDLFLASGAKINFDDEDILLSHSSGILTLTGGAFRCDGDITAFYSSDRRLKTNIKKIEDPLKKLDRINGYMFNWIEKEGIHSNKGPDIGVIAQEIEEIIPEATTTRVNGYKAVRYEKIVPLLIESIKEQQKQIDELKNEIDILKNQ